MICEILAIYHKNTGVFVIVCVIKIIYPLTDTPASAARNLTYEAAVL